MTLHRHKVFWLHFSFWCVYLSFNIYQMSFFQRRMEDYSSEKGFAITVSQLVLTMLIAYYNYFYALPRFLTSGKIVRYLVEVLIPFTLIVVLRIYLQRYIVDAFSHREHYFYTSLFTVQTVAITLFIMIFIAMLRFVRDWFEFEARKKEVENEKLTSELNFLKAQINPHFLFNTLNNLYYLAYSKSENTTEVIAKLSQMMRYMIYESNHPKVLLTKEIEYMQNYISLERLRLNNQIPISFSVKGKVDNVRIAPLILITFLENAFKHGVTNNSADSWVDISLTVDDHECVYLVRNSKILPAPHHELKSGIGLRNVQRRLELSYPGQYELKVDDRTADHEVRLKLVLL